MIFNKNFCKLLDKHIPSTIVTSTTHALRYNDTSKSMSNKKKLIIAAKKGECDKALANNKDYAAQYKLEL